MRVLGIAGFSGAGKTTLVTRLIPALVARGLSVSTVKHAHHAFDVDTPGKDSYEHRKAGASEVLVSSDQRWVLMHEHRGADEPGLDDLLKKLAPVDLVLVEGWKFGDHPKLEVFRSSVGKPMLAQQDRNVIAIATDLSELPSLTIPRLNIDDIDAIADFVAEYAKV
ncbi:MAG: molybdopterin-guanine dinucleotide biosynthesis protein B [Alphaproteobacteria bacterium]|nr:molybdopterin-guanine dinucleotide biosynthesis protein B [Alphaproteobacteria bacterium]